jgi:hypothetical protein
MTARCTFLLIAMALAAPTPAAVTARGETIVLSGETYALTLRAADGAIVSLTAAGGGPSLLSGGEFGLWQLTRGDGAVVNAGPARATVDGERLTLSYDELDAILTARPDHVEFVGVLKPKTGPVTWLALPARLRFDPAAAQRVIVPCNGNDGVGLALGGNWFGRQPQATPSGWQRRTVGGAGAHALFGCDPEMRPVDDPPVALTVTAAGRRLFGEGLAGRLEGSRESVFRPMRAQDVDQVYLDSPVGPMFVRKTIGSGAAWRLSGKIGETWSPLGRAAVAAAIDSRPAGGRGVIGLLAVNHGPATGLFSEATIEQWRTTLAACPAVRAGKVKLVVYDTPAALAQALAADAPAAVVNPYGEGLPVAAGQDLAAAVEAIRAYCQRGGWWFEVAGYPLHSAFEPLSWLSYQVEYPAAFADWLHLDVAAGSVSLYRVQPRDWQPWAGTANHDDILVPGDLGCGGDERGGFVERRFATWVPAGQTWRAPAVRLAVGATAEAALADYGRLNGIDRPLTDKVKPEVLDKLKRGLLIYLSGSARAKTETLGALPSPAVIHFADYLHGGFDKQYPDHLPPIAGFGTEEDFKAFIAAAHQAGDLIEPYTNPTWWCSGPKGPTFEREGEGPLLKDLDGKIHHEQYAANEGYTVTHWHPAVQAANRSTRSQFVGGYGVDVLFQDQCGARSWLWDANPASPTPYAYSEGMVSMVDEDSRVAPLGTEAGWDRVANAETQLCGLSWALSPHRRERSYAERYPRATWTLYPLAERLAHDKCFLMYHDLGQFVTDEPTLAWALALGFTLSARTNPGLAQRPAERAWIAWLDRLQKSVVAPTIGQPLGEFEHRRPAAEADGDDGWVRSRYAGIDLVANLGAQPRAAGGVNLAPYGFHATGPGLRAGWLADLGGLSADDGLAYVAAGRDLWVYAKAGAEAAVELPDPAADASLILDDGRTVPARAEGGALRFHLPTVETKLPAPPPELAGLAPRDWPSKPKIAVLDLGPSVGLGWATVSPAEWIESLRGQTAGLAVETLSEAKAVRDALTAGPTKWLAILNPYGEAFPCLGPGQGPAMLDAIKAYVAAGGTWIETAGYSFHVALHRAGGDWRAEHIGPDGMGLIGAPVGGGEVDAPAEPLRVTPTGRQWLGEALAAKIDGLASPVNRGLPRGNEDPGHIALVAAAAPGGEDYIGGYRLGGWGWLWRVGGFHPAPEVSQPVIAAALAHLVTHPPEPRPAGGPRLLWHLRRP